VTFSAMPSWAMASPGKVTMENGDQMAPLAERMRPREVNEMVGQAHLLGPDSPLGRVLKTGHLFSVIFWGPPGSGKTTLARLMGKSTHLPFRAFSAVTSGLTDLKKVITEAQKTRQETGNPTLLFVDEIHRFNKAQQDAFLPHVESGLIILVGATTQNPSFEVIPPLLSRTRVMILNRLEREDIVSLLAKALSDKERGLGALGVKVEPKGLEFIADLSQGDARVALNDLEAAVTYALEAGGGVHDQQRLMDLKTLETALSKKALPYDKDGEEHYNLISAFHKSLRGGDPQAALYWLYRMLLAGEDPRFICRRMIRFASEDVGLADPHALPMAVSAFEAWERVGPPEGELALAEAAVYLATATKSNALYLAEKTVKQEIDQTGPRAVPFHIRNAPTRLMKGVGYGRGYLYPHNYPGGWVEQAYLPDGLKNRSFYRPTDRGFEKEVRRRLERWKKK
jgi:putative ATPase